MKRAILILAVCFILNLITFGQTKTDDIKTLFSFMQSEKMLDQMFDNMVPMMKQQAGMEISDTVKFNSYITFLMKETKNLTKKLINEDMVIMYDKFFTQDEIKDYIKFYKTTSGQKMISIMPDLQKEMMNIMMTKYLPEFQKKMKAKLEEMKN